MRMSQRLSKSKKPKLNTRCVAREYPKSRKQAISCHFWILIAGELEANVLNVLSHVRIHCLQISSPWDLRYSLCTLFHICKPVKFLYA